MEKLKYELSDEVINYFKEKKQVEDVETYVVNIVLQLLENPKYSAERKKIESEFPFYVMREIFVNYYAKKRKLYKEY